MYSASNDRLIRVLSGFVCIQYYIAPKLYRQVQEIFFVVGELNDLECSLRVDFLIVGKAFGTYISFKIDSIFNNNCIRTRHET